ncbi:hypothetical protein BKA69DRAFT_1055727 [Paraphysoderma sedebokerense]|nr:hypothetical protein BKA69DRAFT_1055727 [Paraphysoderma sedebokerense]
MVAKLAILASLVALSAAMPAQNGGYGQPDKAAYPEVAATTSAPYAAPTPNGYAAPAPATSTPCTSATVASTSAYVAETPCPEEQSTQAAPQTTPCPEEQSTQAVPETTPCPDAASTVQAYGAEATAAASYDAPQEQPAYDENLNQQSVSSAGSHSFSLVSMAGAGLVAAGFLL